MLSPLWILLSIGVVAIVIALLYQRAGTRRDARTIPPPGHSSTSGTAVDCTFTRPAATDPP
jgi:hypothetical protein